MMMMRVFRLPSVLVPQLNSVYTGQRSVTRHSMLWSQPHVSLCLTFVNFISVHFWIHLKEFQSIPEDVPTRGTCLESCSTCGVELREKTHSKVSSCLWAGVGE